jgi:hypothetical protein
MKSHRLDNSGRLLSAYPIHPGKPCERDGENCLWIMTEADRSVIALLLLTSIEGWATAMPPFPAVRKVQNSRAIPCYAFVRITRGLYAHKPKNRLAKT